MLARLCVHGAAEEASGPDTNGACAANRKVDRAHDQGKWRSHTRSGKQRGENARTGAHCTGEHEPEIWSKLKNILRFTSRS